MGKLESLMKNKEYSELNGKEIIDAVNDKVDKVTGKSLIDDTSITRLANTSGSNTGDQDLSGLVPITRTINNKQLNENITLSATDVGAESTLTDDIKLPSATNKNGQILSVLNGVATWFGNILTNVTNIGLQITSTSTTEVPLVIKGSSGQTARLFQIKTSNDVVTCSISDGGSVSASSFTGTSISDNGGVTYGAAYFSSTGVTISRNRSDDKPTLIVNQIHASSTGKLLDMQFAGVSKANVDKNGNITGNNLSGTNTGDQDLSGLVPISQKGVANGVATLDDGSKLKSEQIPYLLQATDNLQTILNSGKRLIHFSPEITYSFNNILLPISTKIYGRGATITSPNTTYPVFKVVDGDDIVISDVNFIGSTTIPNNQALIATDTAIKIEGSDSVRIENCNFQNFLGCAIDCKGYAGASVGKFITHFFTNNYIKYCYFGIALWKESEYSVISNNKILYCRIGIWSQSGNNTHTGNVIVRCRAAFVSSDDTNTVVTDTGINRQHGSVTSCIFNHCKAGQADVAWGTANYLIDSVDYQSVWIDGENTTYPPTFTGNTMYYTDLKYLNAATSGIPFWYISGCIFASMVVSADVANKMALIACTEQNAVTKTNVDIFAIPLPAWETPNFLNGWLPLAGQTANYRKDEKGRVKLRGTLDSGVANTVAFGLPKGYRPTQSARFTGYSSGSVGTIQINAGGEVKVVSFTTFISLDGIEFDTL